MAQEGRGICARGVGRAGGGGAIVRRYLHTNQQTERISDQDAPSDDTGTVLGLLGSIANRVKNIAGTDSWRELPAATLAEVRTHIDRRDNPHVVTRAQLGAAAQTDLDTHTAARNNPHVVTAAQAGAVPTGRTISTTAPLSGGRNLAANVVLDISDATASARGAMTAAQAAKLDGIETSATADQTDAQIQAAVQRTDGSGSGLDADLLDGSHGNAFSRTNHRHDDIYPAGDPSGASGGQVWTYEAASGGWRPRSLPPGGVTSVHGRSGAVVAQSGDYTASQVGATPASRRVLAGNGLTGGGDLTADRTLSLVGPQIAHISKETSQSIPNKVVSTIVWDNAPSNAEGWWSSSAPTVITVGLSGLYLVLAGALFESNSGGAQRTINIAKNGTYVSYGGASPAMESHGRASAFWMGACAVSDRISLDVFQDAGVALGFGQSANPGRPSPYLAVVKLK